MQAEYRLKIGQDEFLLKFDVANVLDFFEKVSFYSNLPKTGPNGETDLKISHRTTKQGYNYYSLVSEQAGQEFRFGQPKEDPKSLFPKGWAPIYKGEDNDQSQQSIQAPLPIPGLPTPAQYQAPVVHQAPLPIAPPQQYQPPVAPPVQMPNPNFPGMVPPHVGPSAAAPTHVGIPATPPAGAGALNPAQAAAANNVLSRFGLTPKN